MIERKERKTISGVLTGHKRMDINHPFFRFNHVLFLDEEIIMGVMSNDACFSANIGDTIELQYTEQYKQGRLFRNGYNTSLKVL